MGATALCATWDAHRDKLADPVHARHVMRWFYGDLGGIRPDASGGSLTEDGRAIADATWVKFVGWQGGAATCEICAGGYTFRSVQPGASGH